MQNYKKSKYNAKKIEKYNRVWDSKAELLYYELIEDKSKVKCQEKFVLQDKFKLNGKAYREIYYKPDFTFYDDAGNLIKVIDVKGMILPEFKIKAKMFAARYGLPITIAKKVARKDEFTESVI
nr:MAG TPA: Endonuclease [Caudoviricetes sp.]